MVLPHGDRAAADVDRPVLFERRQPGIALDKRRRIEAGQWQGGGREAAQRRRASSEAPKP